MKDHPGVLFPSEKASLVRAAWITGQTAEDEGKQSRPPALIRAKLESTLASRGISFAYAHAAIYGLRGAAVCAIKGETDLINLHRKKERKKERAPWKDSSPPMMVLQPAAKREMAASRV